MVDYKRLITVSVNESHCYLSVGTCTAARLDLSTLYYRESIWINSSLLHERNKVECGSNIVILLSL